MPLPHISVVLAMSADGKIGDFSRSATRFPSAVDKKHLETRLAEVDATLFGAATLRAYQTSLPIFDPILLQHRQQQGQTPQPIHIVCSGSGQLDPTWKFFEQPIPRWLLTTSAGARVWDQQLGFDQILPLCDLPLDWSEVMVQFHQMGLERILVMGGGNLVADLVKAGLVDDFWLTVCPLLLGGQNAPTPMDGNGFLASKAPYLDLVSVKAEENEVFLHYRRRLSPIDIKIQLP